MRESTAGGHPSNHTADLRHWRFDLNCVKVSSLPGQQKHDERTGHALECWCEHVSASLAMSQPPCPPPPPHQPWNLHTELCHCNVIQHIADPSALLSNLQSQNHDIQEEEASTSTLKIYVCARQIFSYTFLMNISDVSNTFKYFRLFSLLYFLKNCTICFYLHAFILILKCALLYCVLLLFIYYWQ